MTRRNFDVTVIGGGNIGSAVAFGLSKLGVSVALIDDGDSALRTARGNFGLVWFQGKGLGMPEYVDWSLEATRKWPALARELEEKTGLALNYRNIGGLNVALGETHCLELKGKLAALKQQTKDYEYHYEFLDRRALQSLIPKMELGPKVQGATFSPHDGHVNPLNLLRALHTAFQANGGKYFPGNRVTEISHSNADFRIQTNREKFNSPKLVLAAGLGVPPLAKQLGMDIPVEPERGQILVTERVRPILDYPTGGVRQTAEGSFMFGSSHESVGYNDTVTTSIMAKIARQAQDTFPCLAQVQVVRSWGALRPLTPDKNPVYEESKIYPGAFVLTSHSGVSLASVYAGIIPRWIIHSENPKGFEAFESKRFHSGETNVQKG